MSPPEFLEKILAFARKFIPNGVYSFFQPAYHIFLSALSAIIYGFPSKKLKVVAVTGTKGKSSVIEILGSILEEAGYRVALLSTIHFKIGRSEKRNLYKMTLPGRFFLQRFLREAVISGCDYAVVEITSEAVMSYRHLFVDLDALIFTNLAPEHIERHGSFEKYAAAKLKIRDLLSHSRKKNKTVVANVDDAYGDEFLMASADNKISYSIDDAGVYKAGENGIDMSFGKSRIVSKLVGEFNIYNILAAAAFAKSEGLNEETIKRGVEKVSMIRGRGEKIDAGQNFTVVVDYAHTKESLEALYRAFTGRRKICVLGNTGGGRDKWKRPKMGAVADKYCSRIILTNEDPYDEDPAGILDDMKAGIEKNKPETILDRRLAIRRSIEVAEKGDVVLISGKGTDPYIMEAEGKKIPWDDAEVAREELKKVLSKR